MADGLSFVDEDMLRRAQGVAVLPAKQVESLMLKARKISNDRINKFFNTRDGWILRRIVRYHYTALIQPTRCILCAGNVEGALRPLTNTKCKVCSVPLCRTPRKCESG